MKKSKSVSDFTSERNATLVQHFRKQLAQQSRIDLDKAFKGAAEQPAPRFWVSELRAAVVIATLLKAEKRGGEEGAERILAEMYEEKREMYREIYRRVKQLKELRPDAPVCELAEEVVNTPAPRSYISWHRAKRVIYAEKRRSRLERSLK